VTFNLFEFLVECLTYFETTLQFLRLCTKTILKVISDGNSYFNGHCYSDYYHYGEGYPESDDEIITKVQQKTTYDNIPENKLCNMDCLDYLPKLLNVFVFAATCRL